MTATAPPSASGLDADDQRLLDLLTENARQSIAMLGRRLGMPRSTVQYRIERLERSGAIRGYTVLAGRRARARNLAAHVLIAVAPQQQAAVERKLRPIVAVRKLLSVSGSYDLVAILEADSPQALDEALDELRRSAGIRKTVTAIVLSSRIDR
jgi:DNA-binding Lrp family transcriptional regulator